MGLLDGLDRLASGGLLGELQDPAMLTPQDRRQRRSSLLMNLGAALSSGGFGNVGAGVQNYQNQQLQQLMFLEQLKQQAAQRQAIGGLQKQAAQAIQPSAPPPAAFTQQAPAPMPQGEGPLAVTPPMPPTAPIQAGGFEQSPEDRNARLSQVALQAAFADPKLAEQINKLIEESGKQQIEKSRASVERAKIEEDRAKRLTPPAKQFGSVAGQIYDTTTGQFSAPPEQPKNVLVNGKPAVQIGPYTFKDLQGNPIDPKTIAALDTKLDGGPTPHEKTPQEQIFAGYLNKYKGDVIRANQAMQRDSVEARRVNQAATDGLSRPQFTQITGLARQFDSTPIVKNYNEVANRLATVNSVLSKGLGGPEDLTVVYEFMKALDPTSVVREGEYDKAASAGNIFAGAYAKFNGYLKPNGGFLPPQVKTAFKSIIESKLGAASQQVKALHKDYARRIGVLAGKPGTGEEYLTDYTQLIPDMGAPQSAPVTAAAPTGYDAYLKAIGVKK